MVAVVRRMGARSTGQSRGEIQEARHQVQSGTVMEIRSGGHTSKCSIHSMYFVHLIQVKMQGLPRCNWYGHLHSRISPAVWPRPLPVISIHSAQGSRAE